mmetsp:Transcript_64727/g.146021  ORF Transcript_64727/g.146021 Transcript_64727/m.146021 type:complete len:164 (+) Transcript_64727:76-567(+)
MARSAFVGLLLVLSAPAAAFLGTTFRAKSAVRPNTIAPLELFGGGGKSGEKKQGGMGAMMDQFKQVQELTKRAKAMQDELAAARLDGKSSDGSVSFVVTGSCAPVSAEISEELMGQGADAVGKGLCEALVSAHTEGKTMMATKMQEMYSGLNLNPEQMAQIGM